jgi:hypothetical protein
LILEEVCAHDAKCQISNAFKEGGCLMPINIPAPELQIDFSLLLERIRRLFLADALRDTVAGLQIPDIDKELAAMVPQPSLNAFSGLGFRGELVFAMPCLLRANPRLLGYYRLLLGFSQKEFYSKAFGVSKFKLMETKGILRRQAEPHIDELCSSLVMSACALIDGIGINHLNQSLLGDLMLLTVGAQLRGSTNNSIGLAAITRIFELIHEIVRPAVINNPEEDGRIEIRNAAGRIVLIEFAPDPDIVIREGLPNNQYHPLIAIEVKGGKDFSNVHNRIGEAEKSHQKAARRGYNERWTIVNVDRLNIAQARQESPATSFFYIMSQLLSRTGTTYSDFRQRIILATGIPNPQP